MKAYRISSTDNENRTRTTLFVFENWANPFLMYPEHDSVMIYEDGIFKLRVNNVQVIELVDPYEERQGMVVVAEAIPPAPSPVAMTPATCLDDLI